MLTPPTTTPTSPCPPASITPGPQSRPEPLLRQHTGRVLRYGTIMMPQQGNADESWGTLNPGGALGPDGQYYLLPRLVAEGNYSRIGLARVTRHPDGRPAGVRRLGVVLAPTRDARPLGLPGRLPVDERGVEDARVTYLPLLGQYVMTYTAFGAAGPRLALAWSLDLRAWRKTGLVHFAEEASCPGLHGRANKDSIMLPRPVRRPGGESLCWMLLHRPMTEGRPFGIWASYLELDAPDLVFRHHRPLAWPEQPWEAMRIGAGAITETPDGWLLLYHGVEPPDAAAGRKMTYHAAAMLLDRDEPTRILRRSRVPLFSPHLRIEREGIVPAVVFPTAVHQRGGGLDVYYGAADSRIGCARLGLDGHPI